MRGTVIANGWVYFAIEYDTQMPNLYIRYESDENLRFYVHRGTAYPTQQHFDYVNSPNMNSLEIPDPTGAPIKLGILGLPTVFQQQIYSFYVTDEIPTCENNCHAPNGRCVRGVCECLNEYFGRSCEFSAQALTPSVALRDMHFLPGKWNYFFFYSTTHRFISVLLKEKSTLGGGLSLFLKHGSLPTFDDYTLSATPSNSQTINEYQRLIYKLSSSTTSTFFGIGVFASPLMRDVSNNKFSLEVFAY